MKRVSSLQLILIVVVLVLGVVGYYFLVGYPVIQDVMFDQEQQGDPPPSEVYVAIFKMKYRDNMPEHNYGITLAVHDPRNSCDCVDYSDLTYLNGGVPVSGIYDCPSVGSYARTKLGMVNSFGYYPDPSQRFQYLIPLSGYNFYTCQATCEEVSCGVVQVSGPVQVE